MTSQPSGLTLPLRADLETLIAEWRSVVKKRMDARKHWMSADQWNQETALAAAITTCADQLAAYLVSCVNAQQHGKACPECAGTGRIGTDGPGIDEACDTCEGSGVNAQQEQVELPDTERAAMVLDSHDLFEEADRLRDMIRSGCQCQECRSSAVLPAPLPRDGHKKEMQVTRMDSTSESPQHIDAGHNETNSATVSDTQKRNEPCT